MTSNLDGEGRGYQRFLANAVFNAVFDIAARAYKKHAYITLLSKLKEDFAHPILCERNKLNLLKTKLIPRGLSENKIM